MPYFLFFNIGAALTSLVMFGIERIHSVSITTDLVAPLVGGVIVVGLLKFWETR